MKQARSLFVTKTFQGGILTLIGSIATLLIPCLYDSRMPDKQETTALIGCFLAFGWTLIGRASNEPVYTPDYLPGANQSDFSNTAYNK